MSTLHVIEEGQIIQWREPDSRLQCHPKKIHGDGPFEALKVEKVVTKCQTGLRSHVTSYWITIKTSDGTARLMDDWFEPVSPG